MTTENTARLVRLSDSGQTVADPAEDVRGRKVYDTRGDELGEIDDLLVDTTDRKVRFLQVQHGGILGFGATASFMPVEAVARITEDAVHVNESRERVSGAPRYDPDLTDEPSYFETVYGYYGYPPFWGPGYFPPPPAR